MFNLKKDEKGYYTSIDYHDKYYLPKWETYKNYKQNIRAYLTAWIIIFSYWWPAIFSNNGTFKRGDKVKYNWMAHAMIKSALEKKPKVLTVQKIEYSDKSGLKFYGGYSCASFWVRKLYFWEKYP